MKHNFLKSCLMALLLAGTPLCAYDTPALSVAPVTTQEQMAQGASDVIFNTLPLTSALIGYGWAESGLASYAKILGVDISVLVGLSALQHAAGVQQAVDAQGNPRPLRVTPHAVPKGLSYYAGCAAGVGALGLLLAYKATRCNETAFSVFLKTGLITLVGKTTGTLLRPVLRASGLAPEAQMSAELLKHLFVDTRITGAIQQRLLTPPVPVPVVA